MAETKDYEQELLEIIENKKIAFFDHCFAFTSFSRATAYNHQLDKLDSIKDLIKKNRVKAKNYLLNKWIAGKNPTLQISAFRLLADTDEHKRLNQSYLDMNANHSGEIKIVREIKK